MTEIRGLVRIFGRASGKSSSWMESSTNFYETDLRRTGLVAHPVAVWMITLGVRRRSLGGTAAAHKFQA